MMDIVEPNDTTLFGSLSESLDIPRSLGMDSVVEVRVIASDSCASRAKGLARVDFFCGPAKSRSPQYCSNSFNVSRSRQALHLIEKEFRFNASALASPAEVATVLSCLSSDEPDEVCAAACEAAGALFTNGRGVAALGEPGVFQSFEGGVRRPSANVRSLTVQQLGRLVAAHSLPAADHEAAVTMLCVAAGDASAEVGLGSCKALVAVSGSASGLDTLFGSAALERLRDAAVKGDTERLRVLGAGRHVPVGGGWVGVARRSHTERGACVRAGLFVDVACLTPAGFQRPSAPPSHSMRAAQVEDAVRGGGE